MQRVGQRGKGFISGCTEALRDGKRISQLVTEQLSLAGLSHLGRGTGGGGEDGGDARVSMWSGNTQQSGPPPPPPPENRREGR